MKMDIRKSEFKEISYVECAEKLAKFPSRVAIFYFNGDELNQIKSSDEFLIVVSNELKVYTQV